MNPEQWRRIKDIFQSVMDVEPDRRSEYLAGVCGDDAELRQEVESLLQAQEKAGGFIEEPALALQASEVILDVDPMIGRRIGAYRIERRLGCGGMGTVYFATRDDGEYRRNAAIKMVSRGLDTAAVLGRFRNERQILANLDHPNIARLFDGGTTDDGSPYFIMEYVDGQPIDKYSDERRLSTAERLQLFRQVCAAVDSAHKKLVVHRDIKPGNILVTAEAQPKLLDFGIAKILSPDAAETAAATLTGFSHVMTPDYASPEQVRGEPVTPATDVYALGLLLYELLAGRRPYHLVTRSLDEMIRVVCNQEPERPSIHRRLPDPLDDIVLKALRKEPGLRYQTAAELADDIQAYLEDRPVTAARGAFGYRARRYMKRHLTATAVVVALMAAAAGTAVGLRWIQRAAVVDQQTQKNDAQTPPAPVKARPSIAVMGFRSLSNRSGAAWLSSALSEMFTTELAAGGQLRVVPAENVSRFRLESALKDEGALPKDLLSRIRNNLGADFIVGGSYLIQDQNGLGQLRLDLRVQNTQQDAVVALSETGFESDLFTVVAKAGSRLRERLGLDETGAAEVKSARAAFPVNPEAGRLYTAGLEKMRLFDAIAARSLFEQAAALDSRHALTHSALSAAWSSLGYDGKAEESAKKAYELSENLTREQRLVIEGRYRESQRDWSKAIETYRTLWGFFSDDVEYGLRLAAAQVAAGQAKEALATVQAMRQLPAPSSDDPRIDIAEGDALGSLSDFKRQQQTYAQAVQKGRALGAQLLVARARLFEGRAFFQLGQPEDAIHAFQEAQPLFINAGDRAGVASVLSNLATVYGDRSDIPRTIQMLKESLAISREIGDKRQMATALNNLAIDFKDQGRFADARQTHEEALALRREIGDRLGAATSLNNIGVVFFEQDEFAEAAKRYQESLQICREIGNQRGIVRALHNLSIVKRELGDLAEARTGYEESLAIRKEIGDKRGGAIGRIELGAVLLEQGQLSASKRTIEEALSIAREVKLRPGEAQAFYFLGEIALAEGDLATARKHHEAAQAIRKENREERTLVESRLALANVSLEDGRAIEAEADLRDLRDHLGKDKTRPTEAMIELLIARALLAQNKTGEAGQALTRAQTLSAGTQRNYVRAMITITGARLAASQKQSNVALQNLNPLLAALNRSGAGALQFEARLAQCEAELQSSQASVAKGCFAALQKDATARGFRLVARRANRLGS